MKEVYTKYENLLDRLTECDSKGELHTVEQAGNDGMRLVLDTWLQFISNQDKKNDPKFNRYLEEVEKLLGGLAFFFGGYEYRLERRAAVSVNESYDDHWVNVCRDRSAMEAANELFGWTWEVEELDEMIKTMSKVQVVYIKDILPGIPRSHWWWWGAEEPAAE